MHCQARSASLRATQLGRAAQLAVVARPARRRGNAGEDCSVAQGCACGVFHPTGRFRTLWNVLMSVLILFSAVVVPMQLAFWSDLDSAGWGAANLLIDVIFLCDICVNLRTGFVVASVFLHFDTYCRSCDFATRLRV